MAKLKRSNLALRQSRRLGLFFPLSSSLSTGWRERERGVGGGERDRQSGRGRGREGQGGRKKDLSGRDSEREMCCGG